MGYSESRASPCFPAALHWLEKAQPAASREGTVDGREKAVDVGEDHDSDRVRLGGSRGAAKQQGLATCGNLPLLSCCPRKLAVSLLFCDGEAAGMAYQRANRTFLGPLPPYALSPSLQETPVPCRTVVPFSTPVHTPVVQCALIPPGGVPEGRPIKLRGDSADTGVPNSFGVKGHRECLNSVYEKPGEGGVRDFESLTASYSPRL